MVCTAPMHPSYPALTPLMDINSAVCSADCLSCNAVGLTPCLLTQVSADVYGHPVCVAANPHDAT